MVQDWSVAGWNSDWGYISTVTLHNTQRSEHHTLCHKYVTFSVKGSFVQTAVLTSICVGSYSKNEMVPIHFHENNGNIKLYAMSRLSGTRPNRLEYVVLFMQLAIHTATSSYTSKYIKGTGVSDTRATCWHITRWSIMR